MSWGLADPGPGPNPVCSLVFVNKVLLALSHTQCDCFVLSTDATEAVWLAKLKTFVL